MTLMNLCLYWLAIAVSKAQLNDKTAFFLCPSDVATEITSNLVGKVCESFRNTDLGLLNSLVFRLGVLETNLRSNEGICVDSGPTNYMEQAIPLMGVLRCTGNITVVSSYPELSGRVTLYTDEKLIFDGRLVNVRGKYIWVSMPTSCAYKLAEHQWTQSECYNT